jgi:hypothetical protein
MPCKHREKTGKLRGGVPWRFVHVHQVAHLGQRQAQPLAAQRELEPRAVALRIDPLATAGPGTLRGQQSLVLVEPDCPGCNIERLESSEIE